MTRLDYFTVGSTLLVFMALLVVVMTSYLSTIDHGPQARVVDISARVAFPVAFRPLLDWFFFAKSCQGLQIADRYSLRLRS